MGIPIEPRLSETARRKRQRHLSILNLNSNLNTNPRRDNTTNTSRQPSFPNFGINYESIRAMTEYYESQRDIPGNPQPKGRLAVVRTVLPYPVRPHRSALARLDSRISRLLTVQGDVVEHTATPGSDLDPESLDGSDADIASDEESTSEGEDSRLPWTSLAVTILYVEERDNARVWELGCWAGAHQLAGVDMFQVFLNVLTEATRISTCLVEALWIRDNLEVYVAVAEAIALLKELSAELHASYDKDSSYFLNPITAAPVEIMIEI